MNRFRHLFHLVCIVGFISGFVWIATRDVKNIPKAVAQATTMQSILGDPGMTDPDVRVMLFPPYGERRWGDCINMVNPSGPGPNGNLITNADNARTDHPQNELAIADKCIKPVSRTGFTGLNWFHWNIFVGAPSWAPLINIVHDWSHRDAQGNWTGGFSGTWDPGHVTVRAASATASATVAGSSPLYAGDGNTDTMWNAGATAPQWIELDYGRPITMTKLRMLIAQTPDGNTVHRVYGGPTSNPTTLLHEFSGVTTDGQWLEWVPPTSLSNIRYLRVRTTQTPSWVAWREIQALEAGTERASFSSRWFTGNVDGTNRRIWESTLTTKPGNEWLILYVPQAYEWRQIVQDHWAEGPDWIWQGWVRVTQEVIPPGSLNRYRFGLPELAGCWKQDGSACDAAQGAASGNIVRFFMFDANPGRPDFCRPDYQWNCPPTHKTVSGQQIPRTDTARFPYDAYYYWCGPHTDTALDPRERCTAMDPSDPTTLAQEIMQLAPHPEWAAEGGPTSPFVVGQGQLYRINMGALTNRAYFWGRRPAVLRWGEVYIGPEIFDPNITVSWQSTNWDILKPLPAIPSDFNDDGRVNQTDLAEFRANYPPAPYNARYDLNSDGRINWADAGILFSRWTG